MRIIQTLLLLVAAFALLGVVSDCWAAPREQSFDADWLFVRSDVVGAERPNFDDAAWRKLAVPHDWSIEDLPPRENPLPELEVVSGQWRFHEGDNPEWKSQDLDDSDWHQVTLPDSWEHHSDYTQENAFGWYRRRIEIPPDFQGQDVVLLLGRIDDVDEVWLNGERIGGAGSFPPDYRTAWTSDRRYRVPASLVRGNGSDLLAVRVFDGSGDGGIYQAGTKSVRIGPFDPRESEGQDKTGYVLGGVGWYRKYFTLDEADKRVAIRFDGVYMIADVWFNGHHLGTHPHGYTSFEYELTPYLKPPGEENVLAVRVRNEGKNSRWYSGSGIYRHVWLSVTDPLHVPTWGLFVTTPEVTESKAVVTVEVEIKNDLDKRADAQVRVRVQDAEGEEITSAVGKVHLAAQEQRTVELSLEVPTPKLWSPDTPYLYTAVAEVQSEGMMADEVSSPFGIRGVQFDAEHGLRVNGEPLLLKGGCLHHDNGPLGAAAIDRAEFRRVELLKANGFNAIRTSHNPPSPALLDACDQLGMLVIDEAFDQWKVQKSDNAEDYHRFFSDWFERDVASMVRRDRNHPSVLMWSIGNEIPEQFRAEETQKALRGAVLVHDSSRPVTQAICSDWGKVIADWDQLSDPAFKHLDIAGYNYLPGKYESDHGRHPERVMYGSESYPKEAHQYWAAVEQNPYVIGDFVWTAIDYLGESGIGHSVLSNEPNPFFMSWPWHNAWCGDLDICGFKKPQSYYRDVVWRRSRIEMAVHTPMPAELSELVSSWGWPDEQRSWNWPGHEGEPLQVAVYSRCESVRLELNGEILGEKPVSADSNLTAKFDVPYAPGELRALGMIKGKVVAESILTTSGKPTKLKLTVDRPTIRANPNDLCYVTVEVVDEQGNRVPNAEVPVRFSVGGAGQLAAQASGAPNRPASFQQPACETFQGRCLAILRPTGETGEITLRAESAGLEHATLTVTTRESSAN